MPLQPSLEDDNLYEPACSSPMNHVQGKVGGQKEGKGVGVQQREVQEGGKVLGRGRCQRRRQARCQENRWGVFWESVGEAGREGSVEDVGETVRESGGAGQGKGVREGVPEGVNEGGGDGVIKGRRRVWVAGRCQVR